MSIVDSYREEEKPRRNEWNPVAMLKLADLLEADAANEQGMKFDIRQVILSWDFDPQMNCGTVGCAMGLAAISGEFPGLTVYKKSHREKPRQVSGCQVDGKEYFYLDAAMAVFGIDFLTAKTVFSPNFYLDEFKQGAKGERAVASRLRVLVARGSNFTADSLLSLEGAHSPSRFSTW